MRQQQRWASDRILIEQRRAGLRTIGTKPHEEFGFDCTSQVFCTPDWSETPAMQRRASPYGLLLSMLSKGLGMIVQERSAEHSQAFSLGQQN
jgi:hypothetical protein